MIIILAHLLKWEYQPSARSGSWKGSINNGRRRIAKLFKLQPSLKPRVPALLPEAYDDAVSRATDETGLAGVFPKACLYSAGQILALNFPPGDHEELP